MARQEVDVDSPDSGQGDSLRAAFVKVNDMTTEIYADSFVTNARLADDAVDSDQIADGAVDTVHIGDDQITHDKLSARYTEVEDIATTTGTINLDASSYAAFNLTGNVGTATLNVQNIKTGQAIDVLLSGSDLSSAVITLSDDFTTSAINKVGTNDLDTSGTNMIQIVCIDDTDSDAILNYAIATYTSDTTP